MQPLKPGSKSGNRSTGKLTGQEAAQPLGVIRALAAGFDLVTRHPELMLLPILLDLFLWLGPRLSAYPLFKSLLDFLSAPEMMEAFSPAQAQQMEAMQKLIEQAGQAFNLFWWLSPTLLGVPGLMVGAPSLKTPNGQPLVWPVSSGLIYFVLFLGLSLGGLALSAAYWGMLSSRVREQALSLRRIAGLWWSLSKIAILFLLIVLVIGFPTVLVATVVALVSPLIGQFVILMGGSVILWALFYLAFTVHGVALRDTLVLQAVRTSAVLIQTQFLPAMGLILLSIGIYIGMGFVWNIPPSDSWVRGAGILGHAFTATGLFAATALFYMDRTRLAASEQQPAVNPPAAPGAGA